MIFLGYYLNVRALERARIPNFPIENTGELANSFTLAEAPENKIPPFFTLTYVPRFALPIEKLDDMLSQELFWWPMDTVLKLFPLIERWY